MVIYLPECSDFSGNVSLTNGYRCLMAKSAKQEHKRPRAGIALYQAAMANPTDYLGFLRLVYLRKAILEHADFCAPLEALWEHVRSVNKILKKVPIPVKPLMVQVLAEFNAQLRLIQADVAKESKAEFEILIKEVQEAAQRCRHYTGCHRRCSSSLGFTTRLDRLCDSVPLFRAYKGIS